MSEKSTVDCGKRDDDWTKFNDDGGATVADAGSDDGNLGGEEGGATCSNDEANRGGIDGGAWGADEANLGGEAGGRDADELMNDGGGFGPGKLFLMSWCCRWRAPVWNWPTLKFVLTIGWGSGGCPIAGAGCWPPAKLILTRDGNCPFASNGLIGWGDV